MNGNSKKKLKKTFADEILELSTPKPLDIDPDAVGYEDTKWQTEENEYDEQPPTNSKRTIGKSLRDISLTEGKYAGKPASRKELGFSDDFNAQESEGDEDDIESEDEDAAEEEEEDEILEDKPKKKSEIGKRISKAFKFLEEDSEAENFDDGGEEEEEDMDDEEGQQEEGDDDDFPEGDNEEIDFMNIEENGNEKKNQVLLRSKALEEADLLAKQLEEEDKAVTTIKKANPKDEAQKAAHTKNQRTLWNALLDSRIRIQRGIGLANKMPQVGMMQLFKKENPKVKETINTVSGILKDLLGDLIELKEEISLQNEESAPSLTNRKRKRLETSDSLNDYWSSISELDKSLEGFVEETIDKWNTRTILTSAQNVAKQFKAVNRSVMSQVNQLMMDKDRLIKRTQLRRNVYRVLGKKENAIEKKTEEQGDALHKPNSHLNDYDEEIFDDGDFYQQLLREVIETGSKETDAKYLLEQVKSRKKVRKSVDRRASKGRKIRYNVQEKLVGYCSARPTQGWTSTNELFANLFGVHNTVYE